MGVRGTKKKNQKTPRGSPWCCRSPEEHGKFLMGVKGRYGNREPGEGSRIKMVNRNREWQKLGRAGVNGEEKWEIAAVGRREVCWR